MLVKVTDKKNAYFGRVGQVLDTHVVQKVTIFWVKCGYVEFAVREDNVEKFES